MLYPLSYGLWSCPCDNNRGRYSLTMGFIELIGIAVILYYLISVILWIVLDSDIELAFKERFGQPISSLRGQVVWITGASSGIGKYLAIVLAKNGVKVAISARRENELEAVREQCLAASNGLLDNDGVFVLPMDVLDMKSHDKRLEAVVDHFGRLDILVNNAGRSQRATWDSTDIEVDREMFELNVFSVVNLSRKVLVYFRQNCVKGHLAVTSSGAGLCPVPFSGSYAGAKHALGGYFKSLKVEDPSLNVSLFCPGPVATDFLKEAFTAKPNQKFGQDALTDKGRMTAARCGELFGIALANKLQISWVGLYPVNVMMYLSQYYPNLSYLILYILGPAGISKIREGK